MDIFNDRALIFFVNPPWQIE